MEGSEEKVERFEKKLFHLTEPWYTEGKKSSDVYLYCVNGTDYISFSTFASLIHTTPKSIENTIRSYRDDIETVILKSANVSAKINTSKNCIRVSDIPEILAHRKDWSDEKIEDAMRQLQMDQQQYQLINLEHEERLNVYKRNYLVLKTRISDIFREYDDVLLENNKKQRVF